MDFNYNIPPMNFCNPYYQMGSTYTPPIYTGNFNNFSTNCSFFNPEFMPSSALIPGDTDRFSQPLTSATGNMFGVNINGHDSVFEAARQKAYNETLARLRPKSTASSNSSSSNNNATQSVSDNSQQSSRVSQSQNSRQTIIAASNNAKSTSSAPPSYNMNYWKSLGYNQQKGQALVDYATAHVTGFQGQCGRGVRLAINNVCGTNFQQFGKAKDTGDDFLSQIPQHFKKITNIQGINLATDVPPGAIAVYREGYSNGKGSYCGHIEIMNGSGKGISDGIVNFPQAKVQYLKEIWIPV